MRLFPNYDQLSFSLSDEVAPYFSSAYIKDLCSLIDEKAAKGLMYNDLKELLLSRLVPDLAPSPEIFNRCHEFTKYY
jgi:hypothetical protein